MAQSVLLIPVPEADFVVRPRLERGASQTQPVDADETIAHVTLLTPFASLDAIDAGLVAELRSFFADVLPFQFGLTRVSTFPGGGVYLTPEPAAPFRHLVQQLSRRFPEYPPFAGEFGDSVPHVTVPIPEGETLGMLEFELAAALPISAHAREAALSWWEDDRGRTLERFRFGTAAA